MKVTLLNFVEGPGTPLLNVEGGPGVPLLNFEGGPRVLESWSHFYTMPWRNTFFKQQQPDS